MNFRDIDRQRALTWAGVYLLVIAFWCLVGFLIWKGVRS